MNSSYLINIDEYKPKMDDILIWLDHFFSYVVNYEYVSKLKLIFNQMLYGA